MVNFKEVVVRKLSFCKPYHMLDLRWIWQVRLIITQDRRIVTFRSSPSEVFLEKGVLKICSKFTGEHPCRSAISISLLCNFIEIALRHGCSPVNLLHIFRASFFKNTSGGLLLNFVKLFEFANSKKVIFLWCYFFA